MNAKRIKLKTVEDFMSQAYALPKKQWVFRGHSAKYWRIESTFARFCRQHDRNIAKKWLPKRELEAIRKFQRAGHQFLTHIPDDDDTLGWLSVMRHYGAPTRLLDFTYSPVTALFLAASNPFRCFSDQFTIHAINVQSVMQRACQVLGKEAKYKLKVDDLRLEANAKQTLDFVGFFDGRWNTPRQVVQQGLFMVTSRIETDVEDFLKSCPSPANKKYHEPWLYFEFPKGREIHKKVTNFLLTANQTNATLYPGIEGLAESLFMKLYEPLPLTENYWER